MGARHPAEVLAGLAGCRAVVLGGTDGHGRGRSCPRRVPAGDRWDPLGGGPGRGGWWGYARARQVEGLSDPVRPRRARCRACAVTHVLLPVTMLLRRAYAAERIWAVLTARAEGAGHRRIGASLGIPAATVRGWLRRAAAGVRGGRTVLLRGGGGGGG